MDDVLHMFVSFSIGGAFSIFCPGLLYRASQITMSWVVKAIEKIEAQEHEILHQTVFGGYGTKTSVSYEMLKFL